MRMAEPAPPAPAAMSLDQQAEKQASESAPLQRYLAIRQDLNVEVAPEQLAESWGKVRDLCGTLRCELLSSSLLRETPQQAGNATLEMRVEPADVSCWPASRAWRRWWRTTPPARTRPPR